MSAGQRDDGEASRVIIAGRRPEQLVGNSSPKRFPLPRSTAIIKEAIRKPQVRPTELGAQAGNVEPVAKSEPKIDEIDGAIATCAAVNGGQGLFSGWLQKVIACLAPAYALFLLLLLDEIAVKRTLQHPYFKGRQRGPRTSNLALLAVLLACRPTTQHERKLCSGYAILLMFAADRGIPAGDFATEIPKHSLRSCRAHVRAQRQGAQSASPLAAVNLMKPAPRARFSSTGGQGVITVEIPAAATAWETVKDRSLTKPGLLPTRQWLMELLTAVEASGWHQSGSGERSTEKRR